MAKGQKSSATSATRKKHARKSAGNAQQELPLPKEKKEKGKGKRKEPRAKVFIPPSKPAPVRPDPLDSLGIAKKLPPELLIVLRRLAKKDFVTKRKALEELQNDWVDRVLKGDDENGLIETTLQTALPVWLHHTPSLFLSASRRIRLLAATIHTSLLSIPAIREQVAHSIQESGDAAQVEAVLGSWSMAAEDVERTVANEARRAWDLVFRSSSSSRKGIDLNDGFLNLIFTFVKRALFDPAALYAELNPVQPTFTSSLPVHASPRHKGPTRRPPPLAVDEDTLTRKHDEDEENGDYRKGRLRIGALGVIRWVLEEQGHIQGQLSGLLTSPLFWTALYYGSTPPFCSIHSSSGFIGDNQPNVRKTAWNVLRSLLMHHNDYVEKMLLPILSSAVLRSAWVEHDSVVRSSMWEPLLKFLRKFPEAWNSDLVSAVSINDRVESDEDSDSELSDEQVGESDVGKEDTPSPHSEAFREFLAFLALGCHGSPIQGYPTVVLILSTIPVSILGEGPNAWTDFLTSFWAALDGRALTSLAPERAAGSAAFLSALLECIVFLVRRSRVFSEKPISVDDGSGQQEPVKAVVGQHMNRIWEEIINDRLRVQVPVASKVLARSFADLEAINESLFSEAWQLIASSVIVICTLQQSETSSVAYKRFMLLLSLLEGLLEETGNTLDTAWARALSTLISTVASVLTEQASELLENAGKTKMRHIEIMASQRLAEMIAHFNSVIFVNVDLSSRIDVLMHHNIHSILRLESGIQLFLAYLSHRGNDNSCLSLWHDILNAIAYDTELQEGALPSLLSATERGDIPNMLRPRDDELRDVATGLVEDILASGEDNESRRTVLKSLLEKPQLFFASSTVSGLVHRIATSFSERSRSLMRAEASESLLPLRNPLMLLSRIVEVRPDAALKDVQEALPDFFVFGHILPRTELLSSEAKALCLQARSVWSTAIYPEKVSSHELDTIKDSLRSVLRELIVDIDSRASPGVILQVFSEEHIGRPSDVLQDLFPSQDTLESMLRELPSHPLDPILAILDPSIPAPSIWKEEPSKQVEQAYDRSGLCKYARIVNALLLVAIDNRDLLRQNTWLFRHFLILSTVANEKQLVPSGGSAFFSEEVSADALQEFRSRVDALSAFLVSDIDAGRWHAETTQAYFSRRDEEHLGRFSASRGLSSIVLNLLDSAIQSDSWRESRVLYTIVLRILNGATSNDAEQWMILAKRLEKQAPNVTSAIIRAVNESALEPPSLNRYRNEIAASALGISASKAVPNGLDILHRLALIAPDTDTDIIFLPQNRAINLMKVCQSWIASDEDISEDIESEMTLVFQHLAPILQNVPGSHWEFTFDIIENNLENSSFSDPSTLVALARTLRLIIIIQDLTSTNKPLRAVWLTRERSILTLIRDIVQGAPVKSSTASIPRTVCWEMALTVVQDLPSSLIDHETLSKMIHLILDPSPEVAKMAYSLLFRAAQKRTEYLVVEAGVDTSAETTKYDIPAELLQALQTALDMDASTGSNVLGYLLGWMIVFDLFENASLRVKIGYATQLRDLDLIESNFLPFIFDLLEVYGSRSRPFPLEPWSVEEYYVQLYDSDSRLSPRLFAAHLFYRALLNVPSLISNWWASCRDRQLATAVSNLTTKYYSPVLIAAELRHIKDPAGIAELSGENWNVKVAAGIGEVSAAYTVDEQVMEIAVRLPIDYPLHGIEVREVQKLGIDEKRWRGWLLAVQQIVTSQNGRIVDGLSMFKKNVTHHFENQTECAICYSIISVTELSLPKKRCKTCKNRFHAGCLFKWFNTSHTSSCPLCRSDFI